MLVREIRSELKAVFGNDRLLDSALDLVAYGSDGTGLWYKPDAVVRPICLDDVKLVMTLAKRYRVPVVPRGAASNLTGGALPVMGGIVLDLSLMNRILALDPSNLTATVEPGVVVSKLQEEAEKHSLLYPPDPASNEFSTIGGNIAEGAGGLRGLKYGVTRDYVLGLEAVLMGGEVIRTGTATMKSVTGYDLTRLLVGSEGTLAVITRATLKLIPLPPAVTTARLLFASDRAALSAASLIVASRLFPRALEFVDSDCLAIVGETGGEKVPPGMAMLLVEFDGFPSAVLEEMDRLEEVITPVCAGFKRADDPAEREALWKMRKSISPAIYRITPRKVSEDICVPRSKLPDVLDAIKAAGKAHGVRTMAYGHAGDGNLHVNFIPPDLGELGMARVFKAVEDLFKATVALGGTLSGEHGIGVTKSPFLRLEVGDSELALMAAVKDLFDPDGLLNPGKIFPGGTIGQTKRQGE